MPKVDSKVVVVTGNNEIDTMLLLVAAVKEAYLPYHEAELKFQTFLREFSDLSFKGEIDNPDAKSAAIMDDALKDLRSLKEECKKALMMAARPTEGVFGEVISKRLEALQMEETVDNSDTGFIYPIILKSNPEYIDSGEYYIVATSETTAVAVEHWNLDRGVQFNSTWDSRCWLPTNDEVDIEGIDLTVPESELPVLH